MQAVKGVEVGSAEEQATSYGSKVQDTIHYNKEDQAFFRGANRAGRWKAHVAYHARRRRRDRHLCLITHKHMASRSD